MFPIRLLLPFAAALSAVFLASCGNQKPVTANETATQGAVNPFPPGTYDHFKAEPTYPKTLRVWKNEDVLSRTNAGNSHIVINVAKQRGFLMNGQEVAIDYPVCSGRRSHPTPRGEFPITEKIIDKRSNKYGRIYDADGKVVHADADVTKDEIPEGGRFEGAAMRYWMRLTNDGVGHHVGPLPKSRNPVSHACIRGPGSTLPLVFSKVGTGTRVVIE